MARQNVFKLVRNSLFMEKANSLRVLLFDTKYFFHQRHYLCLQSKGMELIRLYNFRDIKDQDLGSFNGLIVHPGIRFQKEFFEKLMHYPMLRTAIVSDESGEYSIVQDSIAIFRLDDADALYDYFVKPKKQK